MENYDTRQMRQFTKHEFNVSCFQDKEQSLLTNHMQCARNTAYCSAAQYLSSQP